MWVQARHLRALQAALARSDLYRKFAILNRSRLRFYIMDIIEALLNPCEWSAFCEYKLNSGHLGRKETEELTEFINNREYSAAAERLNYGGFFSVPEAIKVNKSSSDKKRTVFVFPKEEMYIQKFISYKLLAYDGLFCDNLYSFRLDTGVKKAICSLVFHKGINAMYSYKLDISDYFNSVDAKKLLPVLKEVLCDNERLYSLIEAMLLESCAYVDGEKKEIRKGILAGSPVSGFLANLYICGLDRLFYEKGILYARYSDDIIFFTETEAQLEEYKAVVLNYLAEHGLSVNEKKVSRSEPYCEWTFLGFKYYNGVIDISDVSKMKLKKKMKRKARALLRWKNKNSAEPERAVRAYINHFNKKLFQNPVNNEITWARWYFPIINTAKSLKELDEYSQQCIRYIATGSFRKSSYNFRYGDMKKLGYITLVNKYYKMKKS